MLKISPAFPAGEVGPKEHGVAISAGAVRACRVDRYGKVWMV